VELVITRSKNTIDIIGKLDIHEYNKVYYQTILVVLIYFKKCKIVET